MLAGPRPASPRLAVLPGAEPPDPTARVAGRLVGHLAGRDRPVRIGRERLRQILHARGIKRTRTWKESADPDKDAKLDRIEYVTSHYPDRCFAFDQFGRVSALSANPGRRYAHRVRKRPVAW